MDSDRRVDQPGPCPGRPTSLGIPYGARRILFVDEGVLQVQRRTDGHRLVDSGRWLAPASTLPGPANVNAAPAAMYSPLSLLNVFFQTPSAQMGNDWWSPVGGWISQTLPVSAESPVPRQPLSTHLP